MRMTAKAELGCEIKGADEKLLFGEGGPRAIYSVPEAKTKEFLNIWKGYPIREIGTVINNKGIRLI